MALVEAGLYLGQAWRGGLFCLPEKAAALEQVLLQLQLADAMIRSLKPGLCLEYIVDRCISSLGGRAIFRSCAGGLTRLGCM
jgi:hypothetical protein